MSTPDEVGSLSLSELTGMALPNEQCHEDEREQCTANASAAVRLDEKGKVLSEWMLATSKSGEANLQMKKRKLRKVDLLSFRQHVEESVSAILKCCWKSEERFALGHALGSEMYRHSFIHRRMMKIYVRN